MTDISRITNALNKLIRHPARTQGVNSQISATLELVEQKLDDQVVEKKVILAWQLVGALVRCSRLRARTVDGTIIILKQLLEGGRPAAIEVEPG